MQGLHLQTIPKMNISKMWTSNKKFGADTGPSATPDGKTFLTFYHIANRTFFKLIENKNTSLLIDIFVKFIFDTSYWLDSLIFVKIYYFPLCWNNWFILYLFPLRLPEFSNDCNMINVKKQKTNTHTGFWLTGTTVASNCYFIAHQL